ncbi:MAG: pentapeptide repeat-containing protein [Bacteroidales bacterium]|nr:pentapeptide repeat-containing protein [Bacteroidales bacterium]
MDWLQNLLGSSLVHAIGWTLIHSIWQISIWAILAAAILLLTHRKNANIRYGLLASVFLGICITSSVTFKKQYTKTGLVTETAALTPETSPSAENSHLPEASHPAITSTDTQQHTPKQHKSARKLSLHWFQDYFDQHLPAIVTLWLLGFLLFFLRYAGSIAWIMRLKHTSEIITKEYEEVLYKYCRKMKLRRLVEIGKSIRIKSPMVIGHFKPIIIFPVQILSGLSYEQFESILLHELAHVKRSDFLINLVQSFIEIIFFYHPAIWWLSASIGTEREHACDDLAIQGGVDADQMAETLARLAEVFSKVPQYSQAFSGNQHKVKNRIHRLIFTEKMKTNLSQKVVLGLAIIVAALVLSFTVERAVKSDSNTPESAKLKFGESPAEETATALPATDQSIHVLADTDSTEEDNGEGARDDEEKGKILLSIMAQGAKEWNAYRENHPGDNFDEALKESNLSGFDLSNFNLSYMNLKEADLTSCNFRNANMTGVNIKEVLLDGATLEKAILTNANMKEISLTGVNLNGAILKDANLKEIVLINCDLSNTDLSGTDLHEADIENCKFKGARATVATRFPDNFDWAAQGIKLR